MALHKYFSGPGQRNSPSWGCQHLCRAPIKRLDPGHHCLHIATVLAGLAWGAPALHSWVISILVPLYCAQPRFTPALQRHMGHIPPLPSASLQDVGCEVFMPT